jgi:hypothetical protein
VSIAPPPLTFSLSQVLSSSPAVLLSLALGLAAAVMLVAGMVGGRWPATHRSVALALVVVVVVALGAALPSLLRERVYQLNVQRTANSEAAERVARERCLNDIGRPDLVGALAFAREQIPERARFRLVTGSAVVPCVIFNMMPRRPARPQDFDPASDWTLYDRSVPLTVARAARRDARRPEGERRYLAQSSTFVIAVPTDEVER